MVPEVAAEMPTATSERRVTRRTDASCTGSYDAYAENWPTALLSWWPIYMYSPGHLKIAGVAEYLSHPEIFEFQDVIKIKNKTTIFS